MWPAAETVLGLLVFGALVLGRHRGNRPAGDRAPGRVRRLLDDPSRAGAVVLLVSSTVFLVAVGGSWWESTTTYLAPNPAVTTLQKAVGTSIVGFGISSCLFPPTLGIQANVNIAYGVHELDVYDPLTPQELYTSWTDASGHYPLPIGSDGIPAAETTMFCPVVTTTASARLFGVGFVLEPHGVSGPKGSVFDQLVGNEDLYRIPGASVATISALGAGGTLPPVDAPGKPLVVTYPNPSSWKVVTDSAHPQVLRLRLTDVPGWHASIDGKPLSLVRFNRIMLQAKIPPGHHTIELHYWPDAFSAGIALAAATVIGLVVVPPLWRRQRRRSKVGRSRAFPRADP